MTFANRIIHDEKLSTISSKIFPRPEAPRPIALITAAVKGIGHGLDLHRNVFFTFTRRLVPHMQRARSKGRIVTTVLISGQTAMAGMVNSSAAKTGPIGANRALAGDIARRNVFVNAVAPGLIASKMTEHLSLDAFSKVIPLGRAGKAEEAAGCVRFLCSVLASSTTGHVLTVNDGPSI